MISIKMVDGYREPPEDLIITFTEQNIGVHFPKSFRNCIKQADEATPERPYFQFSERGSKEHRWMAVGAFLSFYPDNRWNILRTYFERPEFFPPQLVAFSEIGNGDFICFDYSVSGWDDPDPPIVYWNHEKNPEEAVSDIAINFEAFLKRLKPCPDDETNPETLQT
jgi:hypothetical protein